jgi:hypothetical protein
MQDFEATCHQASIRTQNVTKECARLPQPVICKFVTQYHPRAIRCAYKRMLSGPDEFAQDFL